MGRQESPAGAGTYTSFVTISHVAGENEHLFPQVIYHRRHLHPPGGAPWFDFPTGGARPRAEQAVLLALTSGKWLCDEVISFLTGYFFSQDLDLSKARMAAVGRAPPRSPGSEFESMPKTWHFYLLPFMYVSGIFFAMLGPSANPPLLDTDRATRLRR